MAEVEIPMSQLLFLAIGSPEKGAVNFNLLQKFLTEIMKVADLENVPVRVNEEELKKVSAQDLPQPEQQSAERKRSFLVEPNKITEMSEELAQLKRDVADLLKKINESGQLQEKLPPSSSELQAKALVLPETDQFGEESLTGLLDPKNILEIIEDVKQLKNMVTSLFKSGKTEPTEAGLSQETPTNLDDVNKRLKKVEDVLGNAKGLEPGDTDGNKTGLWHRIMEEGTGEALIKVHSLIDDHIKPFLRRVSDIEHSIVDLRERHEPVSPSSYELKTKGSKGSRLSMDVIQQQSASIKHLISNMDLFQEDLDNLTNITTQLTGDKQMKKMEMDVMSEQIEILKKTKADKAQMAESLLSKADLTQVQHKLNRDQFEEKVEELNAHLNDVVSQLDAHGEFLQYNVEELKAGIENKLDKQELLPLKEYIADNLKFLQDKIKILAEEMGGVAAGAKRKIVKDIQCISCDKGARMKIDNTFDEMTPQPGLPIQHSVKPYLTYQLDQVRKQQKKIPSGRNLLHFEEMLHKGTSHSQKNQFPDQSEHIVNRYVGGSHTITTPVQRVTRTGNFFETWGPILTAVNPPPQTPV